MEKRKPNRISVKLKHPNPLFEKWLEEWAEDAKARNSNLQYAYSKALKSLQKFPLPLKTGKDCKILEGFGDKLCKMLDDRLAHGDDNEPKQELNSDTEQISPRKKMKSNEKTPKEYIPVYRSGPYAIIITLYKKSLEVDYPGFASKQDLIRDGQHLCDTSFTKPETTNFYNAWSSMKTLITKNYIKKSNQPSRFSLTTSGIDLAKKMIDMNPEIDLAPKKIEKSKTSSTIRTNSTSSIPSTSSKTTSSSSFEPQETIFFSPREFEIILIIDHQETTGANNVLYDTTLTQLTSLDLNYEVRKLNVGDYIWICRDRMQNEIVLPYIIERKRMDDLAQSITGGRYHEQKYRLKNCGIPNVIYLIESYNRCNIFGPKLDNLIQASINTTIHDGFFTKYTDNLQGTIAYLTDMTLKLKSIYEPKTLMTCPKDNLETNSLEDDLVPLMTFNEFNAKSVKKRTFTGKEQFRRMLMKLKGISVQKAVNITNQYPTISHLLEAYENTQEPENLLSESKIISASLSQTIYRLFASNF